MNGGPNTNKSVTLIGMHSTMHASRAHKRDCPSNSRNRYVGCTLFPKASSADSDKNGKLEW